MSLIISNENLQYIPSDCLLRLRAIYSTLRSAEKKGADLLIEDPKFFSQATIGEASDRAGCSEATFVRLSRKLGYSGYPDMKSHLKIKSNEKAVQLYEELAEDDSDQTIVEKVFQKSIQTLTDTLNVFNINNFSLAVDAICKAKKIVFCGVGDSSVVALAAYQKFLRAGLCASFSADLNIQLLNVAQLNEGDVLVAISHMGRTKSIVELVKYAQVNEITVISITNFPVTPLSKNSDILLLTAAFADHIKGELISKRLAELYIDHNQLDDIRFLSDLTELRILDISANDIDNISS